VDGLLEVGDIDGGERDRLERQLGSFADGSAGVSAEVLAEPAACFRACRAARAWFWPRSR